MPYALALIVLAAVELLELHGVDGQLAWINVAEISELRAPGSRDLARHFAPGTQCVVVMGNAKWLAVRESCAEIKQKLVAKMS